MKSALNGLFLCGLCWVLAACAPLGTSTENGGDLGAGREARPGDVYAQLGREYMQEGQPEVALNKLQYGLKMDPDNAGIHAVLGLLYERLKKPALASAHYARCTELEPQNPYFRNAWGSFLCQQGQYDQADAQFHLALDNPLYDQPWVTQTNAGVCALRAGRAEVAEQYLRQALNSNPRIPLALLKMAQIQLDRGDFAAARDYSTRYAQSAAPSAQSLLLQLKAAIGLKDKAAATRIKQQFIKDFPDALETQAAKRLTLP
jgi:type IV pilus assembly protein PilF